MEGSLSYFYNVGGSISRFLAFSNKISVICLMAVEIVLFSKYLTLLKWNTHELQKIKKDMFSHFSKI